MLASHILRTVDMAKCHIVKIPEHICLHLVDTSNGDLFRITAHGTDHKLMGDQYIAITFINLHMCNCRLHCLLVGTDLIHLFFSFQSVPHSCRTHKWKQMDPNFSIAVR